MMYVGQKFEVGAYNGDEAPVFNQVQWFGGYRLYTDQNYYSRSSLRLNRIFTQDQYLQLGSTKEFKFFDIDGKNDMSGKKTIQNFADGVQRQQLLEVEFILGDTMVDHHRKPLGILDILSAIGGFDRNLSVIGFMIMGPISYHHYIMKAIQKLFLVNTSDSQLIKRRKNEKVVRKEKLAQDMMEIFTKEKNANILNN